MTVNHVDIGGTYQMKVSGKMVTVRVNSEKIQSNGRTGYIVTNLSTGRKLNLRSAARLKALPTPVRYLLDGTEISYADAVNLVNQKLGVGTWPICSVKARMHSGLVIPGSGTLKAVKIEQAAQ